MLKARGHIIVKTPAQLNSPTTAGGFYTKMKPNLEQLSQTIFDNLRLY